MAIEALTDNLRLLEALHKIEDIQLKSNFFPVLNGTFDFSEIGLLKILKQIYFSLTG